MEAVDSRSVHLKGISEPVVVFTLKWRQEHSLKPPESTLSGAVGKFQSAFTRHPKSLSPAAILFEFPTPGRKSCVSVPRKIIREPIIRKC